MHGFSTDVGGAEVESSITEALEMITGFNTAEEARRILTTLYTCFNNCLQVSAHLERQLLVLDPP